MKIFKDRQSAGKLLAKRLKGNWGNLGDQGIVLAIPRGGVVVAKEVARELKLPLDILVTRKIGAPFQPELALGAVDPDGEVFWEERLLKEVGIKKEQLKNKIEEEVLEIKRREKVYRKDQEPLSLEGKNVILVDDGLATGSTMLSAVSFLRRHLVKKIILAIPVASREAADRVSREIGMMGEVLILDTPEYFQAVGQFYEEFGEVTDSEVIQYLKQ